MIDRACSHRQKEPSHECARVATNSNRSYSGSHNNLTVTEIVIWFTMFPCTNLINSFEMLCAVTKYLQQVFLRWSKKVGVTWRTNTSITGQITRRKSKSLVWEERTTVIIDDVYISEATSSDIEESLAIGFIIRSIRGSHPSRSSENCDGFCLLSHCHCYVCRRRYQRPVARGGQQVQREYFPFHPDELRHCQ